MRWSPAIFQSRHLELIYIALVITCAIVLALRMLARWMRMRKTASDDTEARCGRCEYVLIRGSSTVCSECGTDARDGGLITCHTAPPVAKAPAYILAALLVLPLALALSEHAQEFVPFGWRFYVTKSVYIRQSHDPARYAVQAEGDGRHFSRPARVIMVYRNDGGDHEMSNILVVRESHRVSWGSRTGSVEGEQALTVGLLERFIDHSSNTQGAEIRSAAANEIMRAVDALFAQDFPRSDVHAAGPLNVGYTMHDWAQVLTAAVCYLCGALIVIVIVRKIDRPLRRRLQRRWEAETARLGLIPPPAAFHTNRRDRERDSGSAVRHNSVSVLLPDDGRRAGDQ